MADAGQINVPTYMEHNKEFFVLEDNGYLGYMLIVRWGEEIPASHIKRFWKEGESNVIVRGNFDTWNEADACRYRLETAKGGSMWEPPADPF